MHISQSSVSVQWYGQHQSIVTSCCSSNSHDLIVVGLDSSMVSLWDGRSMVKSGDLKGESVCSWRGGEEEANKVYYPPFGGI